MFRWILLTGSLLITPSCRAEQSGQALWLEAENRAQRLIEELRAWRPSGFKAAPLRRVDLSELERELIRLGEEIDGFEHPRPMLGFFPDDDNPTRVAQVLIGSAVDRSGIRPGDQLLSVDGRPIRGWPDMPKGDGPFTLIFKNKESTPLTIAKEVPGFSTPERSREIESEFESLKRSLSELKESAGDPGSSSEETASEVHRLSGAIKILLKELEQARSGHFRQA